MRATLFLLAVAVLPAMSLSACARGESAEDRQMAELREEIGKVQVDRDRFEQRVNALELEAADKRPPPSLPAAAPVDDTPTPKLRVVSVGPDGAEESHASAETASDSSGDVDDGTPRPTIRIINDGHGTPQIEQTIPDEPAPPPVRAPGADPAAKHAYDAALALLNAQKYPQALDAFAAFLVKYPDHPNADNALYWRGVCYFAENDFANAVLQFEGVLARFPGGNKVPDALLELGLSEQKLGHADKSRAYFQRLSRDFAHSEAARRIPSTEKP